MATVPARGVAREAVWLPTATAVAAPVANAAPMTNTAPPATPSTANAPAPPNVRRTLGWVGVGTGAALLVGGAVALIVGRGAASEYNDDPSCPGVGAPTQPGECASRLSATQTLEPIGWAGMALGVGFGAAGAVLVATSGGSARTTAWRVCTIGGVGVVCRVSF